MTYEFRIVLHSTGYGPDEKPQEVVYGTRKHVGTEESAIAAARRTRTRADAARIERVAVHGGATFRDHEVRTFTVGLDPR
jgi:hypothetical protein